MLMPAARGTLTAPSAGWIETIVGAGMFCGSKVAKLIVTSPPASASGVPSRSVIAAACKVQVQDSACAKAGETVKV